MHRTVGSYARPFAEPSVVRRIEIPPEGKSIEQVEGEAIRHTLEITGGNRSAASRILGISRPTLLRKIRKYGLEDVPHGHRPAAAPAPTQDAEPAGEETAARERAPFLGNPHPPEPARQPDTLSRALAYSVRSRVR